MAMLFQNGLIAASRNWGSKNWRDFWVNLFQFLCDRCLFWWSLLDSGIPWYHPAVSEALPQGTCLSAPFSHSYWALISTHQVNWQKDLFRDIFYLTFNLGRGFCLWFSVTLPQYKGKLHSVRFWEVEDGEVVFIWFYSSWVQL